MDQPKVGAPFLICKFDGSAQSLKVGSGKTSNRSIAKFFSLGSVGCYNRLRLVRFDLMVSLLKAFVFHFYSVSIDAHALSKDDLFVCNCNLQLDAG